jgi:tRNA uridine 5-carbamoylmethylation protein Kti12
LDEIEGECITLKNFIKVIETVLPEVKKHLKNKIVVFDGNFYQKEQIDYLVKHLDTPHYAFTLNAPIRVCVERDTARETTLGKEAAKAVHTLVMRIDYGAQINTEGKTADDVVKEILSSLPK